MSSGEPLRVLLIDDHEVFVQSLATALRTLPDVGEVHLATRVADGLEVADRQHPTLAIIDLRMPDCDGTELIRGLAALDPSPRIMVLSIAADERSIVSAFEAGARGFVGKHESFERVIEAARATARGEAPISPSAFARILPRLIGARAEHALTEREEAVLDLVATGAGNGEIASELDISRNTVRNHLANIMRKLDCDSRTAAVEEARRRGLIEPGYPA